METKLDEKENKNEITQKINIANNDNINFIDNKEKKIEKDCPTENNLHNLTKIVMPKHKSNNKRKSIKIRAYCDKCYQFFENGPFSKLCKLHLEKKCDLVPCQKYQSTPENKCIRKFPNINSANRHTHCISLNDIKNWDPRRDIQKCLGVKREHENKFNDIIANKNTNNNFNNHNHLNNSNNQKIFNFPSEINHSFNNNFFFDNNNNSYNHGNLFCNDDSDYFSNNNMGGLIDDLGQLNFNDNGDDSDIKNIFYEDYLKQEKEKEKIKNMKLNEETDEKQVINYQDNDESIVNFFEKIQKETNIANNTKRKLIAAFKKKGILNVKMLRLFYKKYKNWDFLIQKFKDVSTQIEGVALCIEYLLKIN